MGSLGNIAMLDGVLKGIVGIGKSAKSKELNEYYKQKAITERFRQLEARNKLLSEPTPKEAKNKRDEDARKLELEAQQKYGDALKAALLDIAAGKIAPPPAGTTPENIQEFNKTAAIARQFGEFKRQKEAGIKNLLAEQALGRTLALERGKAIIKSEVQPPPLSTKDLIGNKVFDPKTGKSKTYTAPRWNQDKKKKAASPYKIENGKLVKKKKAASPYKIENGKLVKKNKQGSKKAGKEPTEAQARAQLIKLMLQKNSLNNKGKINPELLKDTTSFEKQQLLKVAGTPIPPTVLNAINTEIDKQIAYYSQFANKPRFGFDKPATKFLSPDFIGEGENLSMSLIPLQNSQASTIQKLDKNDPADQKIMWEIFKEAGQNRAKALELAKQKGYVFK